VPVNGGQEFITVAHDHGLLEPTCALACQDHWSDDLRSQSQSRSPSVKIVCRGRALFAPALTRPSPGAEISAFRGSRQG
jgi:hypothetical protein